MICTACLHQGIAVAGKAVPSTAANQQAAALDNFVRLVHHLAFVGLDKKM